MTIYICINYNRKESKIHFFGCSNPILSAPQPGGASGCHAVQYTEHSVITETSTGQHGSKRGWPTGGCPGPACVNSFVGMQPRLLFTYCQWLPSTPRQQSPAIVPETLCLPKPKIFTIWICAEKCAILALKPTIVHSPTCPIRFLLCTRSNSRGCEQGSKRDRWVLTRRGYWLFQRRPFTC